MSASKRLSDDLLGVSATPDDSMRTVRSNSRCAAMNRKQRRAYRVRAPDGKGWLVPELFLILEADKYGRPTTLRACYDEDNLGDTLKDAGKDEALTTNDKGKQAQFVTFWVPEKLPK